MNDANQKIMQVLEDLYRIDPNFKLHEERLKIIIKDVLQAKPDTKFDEQFAQSLRHRLMAQADMQKEKQHLSLLGRVRSLRTISYALGFVAIAAVAINLAFLQQSRPSLKQEAEIELFSATPHITPLDEKGAFGRLALSQSSAGIAEGRGGGSDAAASSAAPRGLGGGGGTDFMLPMYEYQYVYKGEDFTADKNQMEVYRRIKAPVSPAAASSLISQLNLGLVNLNTFNDLGIQSLNLTEDKDYGYNFYVNLQEGTIAISENWIKWPNPQRLCPAGQEKLCYENSRLRISDIPDDQTLIDLADRFLKDHNIPNDNYGQPIVDDSWRLAYEQTADKSNFYIPDIATVIYPLKLNGQEIYDEGGNKTGFGVNINIREKKVSGAGELRAQNYNSSLYDTETDMNRLIKAAENGGYYGTAYYGDTPTTKVIVELGTPQVSYMRMWQYNQSNGQSDELLVPALVFPVTNAPQTPYFNKKNVVVPLVKELLDRGNPQPYILAPAQ